MVKPSSCRRSLQRSKMERALSGCSSSSTPKGRFSSMAVQWKSGLRRVSGTVRAQASNFSQSEASPEQQRSGTPLARMARHL